MANDSESKESKDLFDFELPEGLDDDLGGDWESAFQAEDFMLTPEDEAEVFFEQDSGTGGDELDLASLLEGEDSQPKAPTSPKAAATPTSTEQDQQAPSALLSFLPAALLALPARFAGWFQRRPFYQKILLPGLAAVVIISLCAVIFFRSTNQQLAQLQTQAPGTPLETRAPVGQTNQPETTATDSPPTVRQPEAPAPAPVKNRKKWPMRAFIIPVPPHDGADGFLVRIDLSLILQLDPGSYLPEDKRTFVRDTIFQFFANRPPEELRRYSLARGEMIRNLESWLQKQWPHNPVAAIMFDRYQIIK